MNQAEISIALISWGTHNRKTFPWRNQIPLWQALVAEVMLQRTRAMQAASTFCKFRRAYPTHAAFARASEGELTELIAPLGLRWRGRLLYRLAQEIGKSSGKLPADQTALEAMPGVGPYAAAATLSLHANIRAVIIDSNVVRVLSRLAGLDFNGETRRKRWFRDFAESMTPILEHRKYNYAILDLAAEICRPRKPVCGNCPVLQWCVTGLDRTASHG